MRIIFVITSIRAKFFVLVFVHAWTRCMALSASSLFVSSLLLLVTLAILVVVLWCYKAPYLRLRVIINLPIL
jgi:hypothetical protein